MTRPRTSARVAINAWMVLLTCAFAAALVLAGPGVTAAHAVSTATELKVTIDAVSPNVVTPGAEMKVSATIHNPSAADFTGDSSLRISRVILQTSAQIDEWRVAEPLSDAGSILRTAPITIAAGNSTSIVFSVPSTELGLLGTSDGLGPRGIAVDVAGSMDEVSGRLGISRSFMIWQPLAAEATPAINLTIAAPITSPLSDVPAQTEAEGRLSRVIEASAAGTAISWLVDPAVVLTASGKLPPNLLDTDRPATTPASTAWATRLTGLAKGRDVTALPVFDGDLGVLGRDPAAPEASSSLTRETQAIASGWHTNIGLPAESAPAKSILQDAYRLGIDTVIARSGYDVISNPIDTPGGVTQVTHDRGETKVLVADETLTDAFLASGDDSPAAATQTLLAELVVIARQNVDFERSFLIAVPRTWDPDVAITQAMTQAIESAAFVNPIGLGALSAEPVEIVDRALPRASKRIERLRLTASDWSSLVASAKRATDFAIIADNPEALTAPLTDAVLLASSVSLLRNSEARDDAIPGIERASEELIGSQDVIIGSDVNLISASGLLPVTLANRLDQDVTVNVSLVPDQARLIAEPVTGVRVPAGSQTSVDIPVRAVGSGDVHVEVRLVSSAHRVVATPASFEVRVRADWESRGTILVGGLLALALIAGIFRTIRRGRASTRTTKGPGQELGRA
ncbi:hypothetical protein GCM10010401_10380 [Rarobacter faecitabidus]|uniref:Uncharacterized protein n=1 Tax=Rarobacter faecitabidus TaxID=13243 RepID=A0A542ZPC3_RARFA|nr:DUF6049 family protein [Rarobacter faecitabidus]TQL62221.1 hypothetical protein FB461_1862 [Rarobacter faecitabidus]